MRITTDWHIHSRNSCDGASAPIHEIIRGAEVQGITDFGVTDHVHTAYNLPDMDASREEYLANQPAARFHFGVEVSVVSEWELGQLDRIRSEGLTYGLRSGGPPGAAPAIGLTEADIDRLGIEHVVGGTHWPLYCEVERDEVIRDYHRQNMFLAEHPLVDIVAHPWWWMGHWKDEDGRYTTDPWLDDFGKVPTSMHDEFAAATVESGTAVEINIGACLMNADYPESFAGQYVEYLALLNERGVTFSVASDLHAATYDVDFPKAAEMLAPLGIADEDLWRLHPRA
ncbi:MAG TPA: PHP domain-containing protein [Armatimonadota bacterium]|nr:PHP domain-containing protein [Armatimonadota bacterium]